MNEKTIIGINAPSPEERLVQSRENLRLILAENGPDLINVYEKVLEQTRGFDIEGSFFFSVWPDFRSGVQAYSREYRQHAQFEGDYGGDFPWVSIGLTLTRKTAYISKDINRVTILLGRYPVIKLTREDPDSGRVTEINAEYPLVIASPNRKVIGQIWDANHRDFDKIFNQHDGVGLQYFEATIVEPKHRQVFNNKLFNCMRQAAVLTLTQDVRWVRGDVNFERYFLEYHRGQLAETSRKLTPYEFREGVAAAKRSQSIGIERLSREAGLAGE